VLSEEDLTVIRESLNKELNVLKAKIRVVDAEFKILRGSTE